MFIQPQLLEPTYKVRIRQNPSVKRISEKVLITWVVLDLKGYLMIIKIK